MTDGPKFCSNSGVTGMPLLSYVSWAGHSLRYPGEGGGRLRIPEMQRSEVWGPDRIIGVWRSVLEGMPLGAFYLVPGSRGADHDLSAGATEHFTEEFELLDGQQRTRALVLGIVAPENEHRCLWVATSKDVGLDLFLTTRGQPFGYDRQGKRLGIQERRDARIRWEENNPQAKVTGPSEPDHKLFHGAGGPPPPAKADGPGEALPLHRIIAAWRSGARSAVDLARELQSKADSALMLQLVPALDNLERGEVALLRVLSPRHEKDEGEWRLRLFGRIGTAGVPLSQAEQRFSIFKHHRPGSRAATDKIALAAGRLLAPPEIMSTALRIARAQGDKPTWWPYDPSAFSQAMRSVKPEDKKLQGCLDELLGCKDGSAADGSSGSQGLLAVMTDIDAALRQTGREPGFGLPATMALPLRAEAKEVLAYWRYLHEATPTDEMSLDMIRFALAWELCVWDHQRAVVEAFKFLRNKHDARAASFPLLGLLQSIAVLPYPGGNGPERPVAYPILPPERLDAAFTPIIDPLWRPWDDCALRVVADEPARELYAAWRNSRGRLIAWLQRDYLHTELAKLGPDVGHEDDWPLDLDHLQPSSSFDFDWRDRKRLDVDSNEKSREARFTIGNAVGNFAWLTSTDNRSAGNKPVAEKIWCAEDGSLRLAMRSIFEPEEADRWKRVSTLADSAWSKARMIDFQHAVERRTLWLYRSFWQEAGFQALWDEATKAALP